MPLKPGHIKAVLAIVIIAIIALSGMSFFERGLGHIFSDFSLAPQGGPAGQNSSDLNTSRRAVYEANPIIVPRILLGHDEDGDGIDDLDDFVQGARAEADRKPTYKSAYYKGGYPPEDEGVCTDVIWRAFQDAGYDFKAMVDKDIKANTRLYPRVEGKPDPNIDFRRVPNLSSFFERHATKLTIELIPGDIENLKEWQGGDIVVYDKPYPHIGIVSDKRRPDGVPYLLHNGGPHASEQDILDFWPSAIAHHFRFPKQ